MIKVTGDTHGYQNRFDDPEILKLRAGDYLIVCGDFGYIFENNIIEKYFLDDLENAPFSVLFVDGNHENFDVLETYPVETWKGGKVHRIRKNVLHLMRGQVFTIDGMKFFTMGGAFSIDSSKRKEGETWWPRELPDREEYDEAIRNLNENDMTVDFVITHTMPKTMIDRLGKVPAPEDCELTSFLDFVWFNVRFSHWYCGHWHTDTDLDEKLTALWYDVKPVRKE